MFNEMKEDSAALINCLLFGVLGGIAVSLWDPSFITPNWVVAFIFLAWLCIAFIYETILHHEFNWWGYKKHYKSALHNYSGGIIAGCVIAIFNSDMPALYWVMALGVNIAVLLPLNFLLVLWLNREADRKRATSP